MGIIKLLILYVIIAPFVGIILVENGWYSISAGVEGYANNAWMVYLLHSTFLIFGILVGLKIFNFKSITINNIYFKSKYANYKTLLFLSILLFIMLFFFQGYKVILGYLDKGNFRSEKIGVLGLGFIAFYIVKFFVPSILAYSAYYYKRRYEYPNLKKKFTLLILFFISGLIGFSWGFKSSAIVVMIPALIVLYMGQKIRIKNIIIMTLLFFSVVNISAYLFDRDNPYKFSLLEFIFLRMTVIEGDTFWKVYDLVKNNEVVPMGLNYFTYLIESLGSKFYSLFFSKSPDETIQYKFSAYLTYLVSGDIYQATSGEHNLTGTVASEGLLFLGFPGMLLFSIFSGIITGFNIKLIKIFYHSNKPKLLVITAVCFVFLTWSWLKGGGIVTILHISNFIGIILTYILLILLERKIKL